jgi:ribosome-associated protein
MPHNEILLQDIMKILDDKKAIDVSRIDTLSSKKLSHSYVIASGNSSRHMQSVADYIYAYFKQSGFMPIIEGSAKSGWVLIEAAGIEIHLFKPESREYYNLEEALTSTLNPAVA